MDEYKAMSKAFRNAADILDQLCELEEKEKNGEDTKDRSEELLAKFMVQMMKINSMGN